MRHEEAVDSGAPEQSGARPAYETQLLESELGQDIKAKRWCGAEAGDPSKRVKHTRGKIEGSKKPETKEKEWPRNDAKGRQAARSKKCCQARNQQVRSGNQQNRKSAQRLRAKREMRAKANQALESCEQSEGEMAR